MDINLGDKVRDRVTGFVGVVVAKTFWLNGCIRLNVVPPLDKDGKLVQSEGFDIEQLEVVEKDAVSMKKEQQTGGPMPNPTRAADPRR